ncbi:5699404e-64a4-4ff7-b9a7-186fd47473e3 [Thermothielavioides terrestris]|uniref:5699404e-64a4-4ff7-b9a7-186fd47473e3 n=1 Tax=Thermothielavioides terrestris TaxID=2587410 RepID=A0A446B5F8_9PEZI|nr:5699404e-64a4-4ff7-b9a7-186fd47473e3 [Thermothielavioides terrestris]
MQTAPSRNASLIFFFFNRGLLLDAQPASFQAAYRTTAYISSPPIDPRLLVPPRLDENRDSVRDWVRSTVSGDINLYSAFVPGDFDNDITSFPAARSAIDRACDIRAQAAEARLREVRELVQVITQDMGSLASLS